MRASARTPPAPSIGRADEEPAAERGRGAARPDLGEREAADEARAAREVRRAPAVQTGESGGGGARERRDGRSGEPEAEQRNDGRRRERVRGHRQERDRVELEPRDGRGRETARR